MKNIYVLICTLFCVAGNNTNASPFISEIMYDLPGNDTGKEWIEIVNASTTPLPLTNWFMFEGGVNHRIRSVGGSDTIPAGGVAIICSDALGFSTNHPDFNGNLFESSFELSNVGETIALRDHDKVAVDTITYSSLTGGNGDGNSLHRVGGSLVAMTPTLGINSCFSVLGFSRLISGEVIVTISELISDTTKIKYSSNLTEWFIAHVVFSEENTLHVLMPIVPADTSCFFKVMKSEGR